MKTLVKQSKLKIPKLSFIFGILLLVIIILIAINPAKYSTVAFNGLSVWAKVLVPSLLPFFVLTKLLASTGIIDDICKLFAPITTKLYNCPKQSAYVFLMSIITGYPVGSKLISDLYQNGQISKIQAIKTSSFCSTSGPMFILGTVAIGMFASPKMGYVILISHILGALLNGLFYRNIKDKNLQPSKNCDLYISNNSENKTSSLLDIEKNSITFNHLTKEGLNNKQHQQNSQSYTSPNIQSTQICTIQKTNILQKEESNNNIYQQQNFDFSQSIMSSVNSMLLIGGVICFTFVLLEVITTSSLFLSLIKCLNNLGINGSLISAIFCGFGEITKGCLMLSSTLISSHLATIISTFIISFGGISTFLQAYAFLKGIVPAKIFLLQKFTHAICATAICGLLLLIF